MSEEYEEKYSGYADAESEDYGVEVDPDYDDETACNAEEYWARHDAERRGSPDGE